MTSFDVNIACAFLIIDVLTQNFLLVPPKSHAQVNVV